MATRIDPEQLKAFPHPPRHYEASGDYRLPSVLRAVPRFPRPGRRYYFANGHVTFRLAEEDALLFEAWTGVPAQDFFRKLYHDPDTSKMIMRTRNELTEDGYCLFVAPDEGWLAENGLYRVPLLIMMASWHLAEGTAVEHPELYSCFKLEEYLCSDTSSPYLKIRNGAVICVKEPVVVVRGLEWYVLGRDKAKTVFASFDNPEELPGSDKVKDVRYRSNHKSMKPRMGNGFAVRIVRTHRHKNKRLSGAIPHVPYRPGLYYVYGMARGKMGVFKRKVYKPFYTMRPRIT